MKRLLISLTIVTAAAGIFSACDRDFSLCPPGEFPVANIESWECWKHPTTTEATTSTTHPATTSTTVTTVTSTTSPSTSSPTTTTSTGPSSTTTIVPLAPETSSTVLERELRDHTQPPDTLPKELLDGPTAAVKVTG